MDVTQQEAMKLMCPPRTTAVMKVHCIAAKCAWWEPSDPEDTDRVGPGGCAIFRAMRQNGNGDSD